MSRLKNRDIRYTALATKVLAVALQGGLRTDWAAYIDAVPGKSHASEWQLVAREGTKLSYLLAKTMFPDFDEKYKWRH